ncbi:hypothetical protein [Lactococcus garvieae]|uniref:hypothetical protein n=1 Tax=Lactococcus garvieae TaxID=1363 RepID=UPI0018D79115|nr:hypothetical protein [Lactococcus garvieae]QPS71762.1 hypothetical protein I6G50_03600 [Lactococcus garvieae]
MNNTTLRMSQKEIVYKIKYAWSRQRPVEIQFLLDSREVTTKGKIFGIDYDLLYIKEEGHIRRISLEDIVKITI